MGALAWLGVRECACNGVPLCPRLPPPRYALRPRGKATPSQPHYSFVVTVTDFHIREKFQIASRHESQESSSSHSCVSSKKHERLRRRAPSAQPHPPATAARRVSCYGLQDGCLRVRRSERCSELRRGARTCKPHHACSLAVTLLQHRTGASTASVANNALLSAAINYRRRRCA